MPRRRRDQQAAVAAPGQPYGENVDQIQAQNVIPLPNVNPPQVGEQAAVPGGPTDEPQAVDPMAALLAAAQATPPPQGGLFGPSQRPAEPVTAGMALGAGPGPEAINQDRAHMRTVADTFRLLADVTGSPMYRRLAEQAMTQGV